MKSAKSMVVLRLVLGGPGSGETLLWVDLAEPWRWPVATPGRHVGIDVSGRVARVPWSSKALHACTPGGDTLPTVLSIHGALL